MELIKLIKNRQFEIAKKLLEKRLKESPNDIYLLTQMANIFWNLYKDEEALAFANKAKAIDPAYPLLLFTRGRILWSLNRYELSITEWDTILGMKENEVAGKGFGTRWAKSVINDSRYYKADCLFHLFRDREALILIKDHLAHRGRGIESDFSKKDAVLFYKILKYSHPHTLVNDNSIGYASESQRNSILKKIDSLEQSKDWKKLVHYLKVTCSRYPKEYYLETILSEYCKNIGDRSGCLDYSKTAFEQEPYDPLVKYNYAVALMVNNQKNEALLQFKELIELGLDYIAYSEHGEGIRWAKKLLSDAHNNIQKITGIDFCSQR